MDTNNSEQIEYLLEHIKHVSISDIAIISNYSINRGALEFLRDVTHAYIYYWENMQYVWFED